MGKISKFAVNHPNHMTMKKTLIILITLLSALSLKAESLSPELKDLLSTLDSTLAVRDLIVRDRQLKIDAMKSVFYRMSSSEEEYLANKWLFEQYKYFNLDSASVYADRAMTSALTLGDRNTIAESKINRSYVFTAGGRLMEAMQELSGIRSSDLDDAHKVLYFGQLYWLYACQAEYLDTGPAAMEAYQQEFVYADSALMVIPRKDPYYDVYSGWKDFRENHFQQAASKLEERLSLAREYGYPEVQLMYLLSCNYRELGDKDKQLEWLIRATIADIRLGSQDNLTMKFLSRELKDRGYIEEAYGYLYTCFTMAIESQNRVRMVSLLRDMGDLQVEYDAIREKQSRTLTIAFSILTLLLLALVAAMVFIRKQMRKITAQHREMKQVNSKLDNAVRERDNTIAELSRVQNLLEEKNRLLDEGNAELERLNAVLRSKNTIKEEYIGFALSQSSDYITKLDEYRKDIYRLVRAKEYDDIRLRTSNPIEESELKAFYKTFDTVFLKVYPDFVRDVNSLLQEDQQIVPRESGRLTAELRIFALVRLGITDSGKIADFLHCSIQTVYNNRLKVRQKAKDREHFDDDVRGLGL